MSATCAPLPRRLRRRCALACGGAAAAALAFRVHFAMACESGMYTCTLRGAERLHMKAEALLRCLTSLALEVVLYRRKELLIYALCGGLRIGNQSG